MKNLISNILTGVVGLSAVSCLWSCSAESPFENEGFGIVQLRTVVNSITTRADESPELTLDDKCVVYISSKEGLVYKKQGLQNVDPQITLKTGSYVAEAWTGDSVTASFDKKFYRGYQPFDVSKGSTSNVVVNCQIANVVVSINTATINPSLMKDDYKIVVKNSRGELVFTKDNAVDGKAYFMMPNDDKDLEYTITGTRKDGDSFSKNGIIPNVQRAHHYILNFEYNPGIQDDPTAGAVFIKINIKDEIIKNDNVTVFSRPTLTGVNCNIEKQFHFINDDDIPEQVSVQICGDGLDDIELSLGCCTWKAVLGLDTSNDLIAQDKPINFGNLNAEGPIAKLCKEKGIEYIPPHYNEETKIETAHLNFAKQVFQRLILKDTEHVFNIRVTDKHGQESTAVLHIARTAEAITIADPIETEQIDQNDWQNIKAYSVNIPYSLADEYEGTPGIEYSKADEDNWIFVPVNTPANAPRKAPKFAPAKKYVTLTRLQPATSYKYRAACGEFHSDAIMTFTTESVFTIPFADMETWNAFTIANTNNCKLPGTNADEFWGNGNPGSMSMGVSLTQESEDMKKSGKFSAKLRSQFVGIGGSVGKFAAGNLFAGTYIETQGTDGHLKFGRPYNGSHPVALRVWVNYRPGTVEKTSSEAPLIVKGGLDIGQIYVALTTDPIEIFTKKSTRKLFNKDDKEVLAYGEHTFDKVNYGPDGQLEELIIPIEYFDRATSGVPTHLVIVCSASKYGDYFCGGEGSTMYLDDFELIYE